MKEKKNERLLQAILRDYVERSPANLIPYARNSRTHSDKQVAQIAASIKEFGFTNPILIDGDNCIIAGHGRVLGALKLGMKEVPCLVCDGWTDAQKKAYIIADNKLALNAGWDDELLSLELAELDGFGFDLSLTGFDESEVEFLIGFDVTPLVEMPNLKSGDGSAFRDMTFTLHGDQFEQVSEALKVSKSMGDFVDTGNENSNGNALARICETFLTQNG